MKTFYECRQDTLKDLGYASDTEFHGTRLEFIEIADAAAEEYKDLHLKTFEKKLEIDYQHYKDNYKAEIDLDALCWAVAEAENDYHEKYVRPLFEILSSTIYFMEGKVLTPLEISLLNKAKEVLNSSE